MSSNVAQNYPKLKTLCILNFTVKLLLLILMVEGTSSHFTCQHTRDSVRFPFPSLRPINLTIHILLHQSATDENKRNSEACFKYVHGSFA